MDRFGIGKVGLPGFGVGEFRLPVFGGSGSGNGGQGNAFHESLVDAWFMSGYANGDSPASIRGVKGNEIVLRNFAFTSESGFGEGAYEGGLVFDGVDDYGICTGLPILDDYTVICRREIVSIKNNSAVASKRTNGSMWNGAFTFERQSINTNNYLLNYGAINIIPLAQDSVSYQTSFSYNGTTINRGTVKDTDQLSLGCALVTTTGMPYELLNCVIYYFALYNKSLTPEYIEEEKVKLEQKWNSKLNKS